MGGNAFPLLNCIRLSAKDYQYFETSILKKLKSYSPESNFYTIPYYSTKETFGDCDILFVSIGNKFEHFKQILETNFILRNGPITSFAVPCRNDYFQLDLIRCNPEWVHFARDYFSYNDLGNLLGRVFHRAGFKFGHEGLKYVIREESHTTHVLQEITLTTNFQTALEFMGYDYIRFTQGFSTLEDMFRYVCSVPLASQTTFRLDEVNHAARIRDRKRKTYQLFLLWVQDPDNHVPIQNLIDKQTFRRTMLEKSFSWFPHFAIAYKETQVLAQQLREVKTKYNGQLVSDYTGLSGKDLGKFMAKLKEVIIGESLVSWGLNQSEESIKEEIINFYKKSLYD